MKKIQIDIYKPSLEDVYNIDYQKESLEDYFDVIFYSHKKGITLKVMIRKDRLPEVYDWNNFYFNPKNDAKMLVFMEQNLDKQHTIIGLHRDVKCIKIRTPDIPDYDNSYYYPIGLFKLTK